MTTVSMDINPSYYIPTREAWPLDNITIGKNPPMRTQNPAPAILDGSTVQEILGFTNSQRQQQCAFHEAGHIAAWRAAGVGIVEAHIAPEGDAWGPVREDPEDLEDTAGRVTPEPNEFLSSHDLAVCFAAGERSADRWLRLNGLWSPLRAWENERMAMVDRGHIHEVCVENEGKDLVTYGNGSSMWDLGYLRHEADALLENRWSEVEVIASALLSRLRLTGNDIDQLADIRLTPDALVLAARTG